MDYLWTPWRYQYMEQVTQGKQPDCIFCDALERNQDDLTLIVGARQALVHYSQPVSVYLGACNDRAICACSAAGVVLTGNVAGNDGVGAARRKGISSGGTSPTV